MYLKTIGYRERNQKKSLIALAVLAASPAAFAATSNVEVYGVMNIAVQDTDTADRDMAVVDNVSRIGVKGTEDLGGGMSVIWQIEQGLSGAVTEAGNGIGGGTLASRNTFIGLKGGFGTVLAGRHDTPYKLGTGSLDIFADTIADYNGGNSTASSNGARLGEDTILANAHDARSPQAVAYVSPEFGGFHFAVAGILTNTAANGDSGDTTDGVSATAVYKNGPLFASYSYQKVEDADTFLNAGTAGTGDSTANKVGLGYAMGDLSVGAVYETVEVTDLAGIAAADVDRDAWAINGVYKMGPIALKAQYGNAKTDAAGANVSESDLWAVGVDYAMSKRTTVYVVYANSETDYSVAAGRADVDTNGWNIGLKHSF